MDVMVNFMLHAFYHNFLNQEKKKAFVYLVEQRLSPPGFWSLEIITDTRCTGSHAVTQFR